METSLSFWPYIIDRSIIIIRIILFALQYNYGNITVWIHYHGVKKMEDDLRKWQQQLISEIKMDDQHICKLQSQLNAKYEKLKHVDALLGVSSITRSFRGGRRGERGNRFLDECERILRASPEPMHVDVLAQRLLDDGIQLPGAGTVANVISMVWRSPRFKRIRKGTYIPI